MNIQGFDLVSTEYEMLFERRLGFSGRNVCIYVYVLFMTAGEIVIAASGSPGIPGIRSASKAEFFRLKFLSLTGHLLVLQEQPQSNVMSVEVKLLCL